MDNLPIELTKKGFGAADLLPAFAMPGGSPVDLENRPSPEFDLKSELLSGRATVLTKTDCLFYRDKKTSLRTSRFYNFPLKQMIGAYENWVFAQPAKDLFLVSSKSLYDYLDSLMQMDLQRLVGAIPPHALGVGLSMVLPGFESI